jgi:Zn-dependent protease with chaperone function
VNEDEARAILAHALPAWVPWGPLVMSACLVAVASGATLMAVLFAMLPRIGVPDDAHWTARARRTYPARAVATTLALLGPVMVSVLVPFSAGPLSIVPGRFLGLATFFLAMFASQPWVALASRGAMARPIRVLESLRGQLVYLVTLLPHLVIMAVVAVAMPTELSPIGLVLALAGIAPLEMLRRGTWLVLAEKLGLATRATGRVRQIVDAQSEAIGVRPRGVWILAWPIANALAFVHSGDLAFTERITLDLDDEELAAVAAHELGHLAEGEAMQGRRFLSIASFYPMVLVRPLWALLGWSALFVLLIPRIIVALFNRRLARHGEEHADGVAHEHTNEGVYARALERLHEANAMPAALGPGRRAHPDLYDRMLKAGVTPSYPRPSPPSRGMVVLAMFVWMFGILAGWIVVDTAARSSGDRAFELAFEGGDRSSSTLDDLSREVEDDGQLRVAAAALVLGAAANGDGTAERLLEAGALLAQDGDCPGARALFDQGRAAQRRHPADAVRPEVEAYIAPWTEHCR